MNYDAIEVSKTEDIPYDYDGEMGVTITFMEKNTILINSRLSAQALF